MLKGELSDAGVYLCTGVLKRGASPDPSQDFAAPVFRREKVAGTTPSQDAS